MIEDVHRVLRLLFAINRQWDRDWKWLKLVTTDLSMKPHDLAERIEGIFSMTDSRAARLECNRVILETLDLVPPPHDVSRARTIIADSLGGRMPQMTPLI
jgi:hypothetical protein